MPRSVVLWSNTSSRSSRWLLRMIWPIPDANTAPARPRAPRTDYGHADTRQSPRVVLPQPVCNAASPDLRKKELRSGLGDRETTVQSATSALARSTRAEIGDVICVCPVVGYRSRLVQPRRLPCAPAE